MSYIVNRENIDPIVVDSILQLLKEKNNSSFGDLVRNIKASYHEVLKHVLYLKQEGIITKQNEPTGYYKLTKK